jgi:hypothetical protein
MITLPNSYSPDYPSHFKASDNLTVTFAKYHGHCYRVQMDPTDPLCSRSFVVWEPALWEPIHQLSLEQTCGLHLISAIVQTAYGTFSVESKETLRSSLIALEGEAIKQRIYWMESPDLSQFWQFLPNDIIDKIFSYLNQHDILQLRGVCQTWRGADEMLWKIWVSAHRVFFPQHAASECNSILEFRQRKENYLKKMTLYEDVTPKNEYNKRMRHDNWITETHIIDFKQEDHSKKIKVTERASGEVVLSESLPNQVMAPNGGSYHHCPGWFFIDDLIVGHNLKTGTLQVFDPTRGMKLQTFMTDPEPIGQVQRESEHIIATFSERKILQRWNLCGGLESTIDLSHINGHLMKWERELMLFKFHPEFRAGAESTLIDLSQPTVQVIRLPEARTFERYGNGYLTISGWELKRYVKTPAGLDLCWVKNDVSNFYVVGETVLCDLRSFDIVMIDPETGVTKQLLSKGKFMKNDIFIEANKLFVGHTDYVRATELEVIDIPTGERLFYSKFSHRISFAGVNGDTIFVYYDCQYDKLYTLDPQPSSLVDTTK